MRIIARAVPLIVLAILAGCTDEPTACCEVRDPLRVVNAFTTPVDVVIDGNVVITALAAGSIATAAPAPGTHTLELRPAAGASVSKSITTATGATNTLVAVRTASGVMGSIALDDTGSVVPSGKTKVRVLHLAANTGELQVYRTQPDYQTPISWQFPFTYQAAPDPLTAPFYQSDVGSWEIRVWETPANSSGWASSTVRVVIPLGSGEKRTVLILDKPGGGVRLELL